MTISTAPAADQCGYLQCLTQILLGYSAGNRCPRPAPWHSLLGSSACSTSMKHRRKRRALHSATTCSATVDSAAFRPIEDPRHAPWGPPIPQRNIQRQTAGGTASTFSVNVGQTHHRTLAKLLFDLSQRGIQCFLLFRRNPCVLIFRLLTAHIKTSVFAKILSAAGSDSRKRGHLPGRSAMERHEPTISIIAFPTANNAALLFLKYYKHLFSFHKKCIIPPRRAD